MSKSTKGKKSKVPKLTEEEYAAYISSLKGGTGVQLDATMSALNAENGAQKPKES